MGLDSVELLVRFEKYFEVEVPDAVSEMLYTPADVAVWISRCLGVPTKAVSPIRQAVERQLEALFAARAPVAATGLLDLLPDGEAWAHHAQQLTNQAGWQLPEMGWLNQLFNWATSVVPPEPGRYCFADLIDWTLARNYEILLTKPWQNQYEVLRAIIGITSDSSGVEISEISPDSHFVLDLGID